MSKQVTPPGSGDGPGKEIQPIDLKSALEERYPEGDIPRPPHWTGFRLSPRRIEFWQDRQYRLHDRRLFVRDAAEEAWSDTLLYP